METPYWCPAEGEEIDKYCLHFSRSRQHFSALVFDQKNFNHLECFQNISSVPFCKRKVGKNKGIGLLNGKGVKLEY